ncbi:MAG: Npun_F5749 family FMN-dependent PPOX-type flavoprotein [Cyanobacteria bacterium P01_F01_bin.53]
MHPVEPTVELAPWRSPLSRALHCNRSQAFARYLQLATVRPNGTPANRTVVFRGFLGKTNQLMFITDRRSEKIEQLSGNPHAEACWYFTKTREQFRLTGVMTLITADTADTTDTANSNGQANLLSARQQIWQNISANAKIQFTWPHPKAPRAEPDAFNPPAPDEHTPDEHTPPPTFCLMLLTVNGVDHLSLRGEPQNRVLYQRVTPQTNCAADTSSAAQWEVVSVNP